MNIYTNADWEQAVREVEAAEAVIAAIVDRQAESRKRIVAEKEVLDAELDSPISRRIAAWNKKFKLQERLLGPWIIDRTERWGKATIYCRNTEKDAWSRRGWLRVWLGGAPVWRFEYGGYSSVGNSGDVLLGTPTDKPGDFEARLNEATNLLIKAGFIFP